MKASSTVDKGPLDRPGAAPALEEIELGYFIGLLGRYWAALALCFAAGLGLTTGFYLLQEETYESKIILMPSKAETPSVGGLLGLASLAKDGSGDMDFFFGLLKSDPVVKRLFEARIPDSLGRDSVEVRKALKLDSLGPKMAYLRMQNFQKLIKVESKAGGLYEISLKAGSLWLSESLLDALVGAAFAEYYDAQRNRIRVLLNRLAVAIDSAGAERAIANRRLVEFKERNYGIDKPQSLSTLNDLTVEYKVKEEKYLLVKKEMEMSNLELVKSLPPITVLEKAESPPWRISPRKKIIFPLGAFLSLAFGYFGLFAYDMLKRQRP